MKKHIATTIVFFLFLNVAYCQITKQKIRIERIKYVNEKGSINLTFNMMNITSDTLYLSRKKINIRLIKNHKSIKWEYPKFDIQIFVKPVLRNGEQIYKTPEVTNIKDPKEKAAKYFANKLFLKNSATNNELIRYRDRVIQNIVDDCIILLPLETYEYETFLFSKKFDKTCKVSVKYSDNKKFTYFLDESGKKIEITN
jgi:hypothetical protein